MWLSWSGLHNDLWGLLGGEAAALAAVADADGDADEGDDWANDDQDNESDAHANGGFGTAGGDRVDVGSAEG